MAASEEFQGFVPVSILMPGQRLQGKVWKFANRRLLQQIEDDKRQFLPVIEAKLYNVVGDSMELSAEFDVLAVSKAAMLAIEPKDTVTPRA
jgi:hypothetical protein